MRICLISDTHEKRPQLPNADLLIHHGDLTRDGSVKSLKKELEWLASLRPQFKKGVIFVPGNHDLGLDQKFVNQAYTRFLSDPSYYTKPKFRRNDPQRLKELFAKAQVSLLINESITIEGLKIYGSPLTPTFNNWAFMENELELAKAWNNIPEDTDILITHGPPQFILDHVDGRHPGSASLTERVKNIENLKVHAFGHIHEGHGYIKSWGKLFINASTLDGKYRGFNPIFVLDTANWEIAEIFGFPENR